MRISSTKICEPFNKNKKENGQNNIELKTVEMKIIGKKTFYNA